MKGRKNVKETWCKCLDWGKNILKTKWPKSFNIIMLLLFSMFMPILIEWVANGYSIVWAFGWAYYQPLQYFNTVVFIFLCALMIYCLINNSGISILINGLFFGLFAAISYFKLFYRSEPLFPWDFVSFREAAQISSSINLTATISMAITVIALAVMVTICILLNQHKFRVKGEKKVLVPKIKLDFKKRIISFVIAAVLLCAFTVTHFFSSSYMAKKHIETSQWRQQYYYTVNGLIPSFLMNIQYTIVKAPKDYKKDNVNDIVNSIAESKPDSNVKPNIIVLQDESYCDASQWKNVKFSQNVTENLDKIKKEGASGTVLTPSFSGGTSISEFEVITGFNESFLPSGSTPYQQYCNQKMPSYVSYLKSTGYNTIAVHSYGRNFWNRNVAYKSLGFDKFYAEDTFVNPERVRDENRITDLATVKKTIWAYEQNKKTGKPFFNLTVTMQNHEGYNDNEYPDKKLVKIKSSKIDPSLVGSVQTYVTGLRDADRALKYLTDYFSKVKEPTIIVYYGDHLVGIQGNGEKIYQPAGYISDTTSAQSKKLMHSPPFVIWDNYKHVKAKPVSLSMYQLLPYMSSLYNLSRPLWFDYLSQQRGFYTGDALDIYLDKDGNSTYSLKSDEAKKYYKNYSILQYDTMFGKGYGLERLYSPKTVLSK